MITLEGSMTDVYIHVIHLPTTVLEAIVALSVSVLFFLGTSSPE